MKPRRSRPNRFADYDALLGAALDSKEVANKMENFVIPHKASCRAELNLNRTFGGQRGGRILQAIREKGLRKQTKVCQSVEIRLAGSLALWCTMTLTSVAGMSAVR